MKINENLSVLFWLYKAKKSKDGLVPIYGRITVGGLRSGFSTGKKIDPKYWDEEKGYPEKQAPDYKSITSYIKNTEIEIERQYNLLQTIEEVVSAEMVKDSFLPKKSSGKGLLDAVRIFISDFDELVNAGKKSNGTLRRYKRTEKKVIAFLKEKWKQQDINLEKVDFYFAEQFYRYLLTKGINDNTSKQHVKTVKQIMKKAVNLGWASFSPITEYKCSYKHPKREYSFLLNCAAVVTTFWMRISCLLRPINTFNCNSKSNASKRFAASS